MESFESRYNLNTPAPSPHNIEDYRADEEWHNRCLRARTNIESNVGKEENKHNLTANEKLILYFMLDRRQYKLFWASQKTIGKIISRSIDTVQRTMPHLENKGLIRKICSKRWEAKQMGIPVDWQHNAVSMNVYEILLDHPFYTGSHLGLERIYDNYVRTHNIDNCTSINGNRKLRLPSTTETSTDNCTSINGSRKLRLPSTAKTSTDDCTSANGSRKLRQKPSCLTVNFLSSKELTPENVLQQVEGKDSAWSTNRIEQELQWLEED